MRLTHAGASEPHDQACEAVDVMQPGPCAVNGLNHASCAIVAGSDKGAPLA